MNWNLDDICKKQEFDSLIKEIEQDIAELDKWWPKLDPEMATEEFKKFIGKEQKIGGKIRRALHLPELMEAINQKDTQARLMKGKAQEMWLKVGEKSRKFDHWLKGKETDGKTRLDDRNAKRLFSSVKDLEYVLSYNRKAEKHTLGQKEEEILDNKDIYGQSVISDLRGLIETEMVFTMGKRKIKTQAELLKFVHSSSSKKRKIAYDSLFREHQKNIDKLGLIYQSVVKNWDYEARLRGYDSPISVRNFANHVSDKSVASLLKVCEEQRNVFWDYFKYKAKEMGRKRLSRYDLYAPLKRTKEKKYSFEDSKKIVLEAYDEFDPEFGKLALRLFTEQHIDALPKKNKTSGAFCATIVPEVTPYVMLNHTGSFRDVSTMAHELGHAIHSLLANHHQPDSQHANLPLSETASTFGEMILFEKMLNQEQDKEIKKQMLWEKIAESYATILRQNYFIKFEIEAHELISNGITTKDLSQRYLQNLREQFGKSMIVPEIFKYEWLYIGHIYESPFYCYAYNFGELLSLSLFARYKKEGPKFVEKIKTVLKTGGSRDPAETLREIGVDTESEDFWRGGFRIVEKWIADLKGV